MILGGKLLAAASFLVFVMGVFTVPALSCEEYKYEAEGRCCPMCGPGEQVKSVCNEFKSTSCIPCTDGTFMDKPNALKQCNTCKICYSVLNLEVQQPCTAWTDTVCGAKEGYYCSNPTESGCAEAQKHRQCEEENPKLITAGTPSSDAQCGGKTLRLTGVIVGAVIGSLSFLAAVVVFVLYRKKKICQKQDTEVNQESSERGVAFRDGSAKLLSVDPKGKEKKNLTENRADPTTHEQGSPGSRDSGFYFRDRSQPMSSENPEEEKILTDGSSAEF